MRRRGFIRTVAGSGAAVALTGQLATNHKRRAEAAEQRQTAAREKRAGKPTFRDLGWVWEGQGLDPGVPPSIYGLGQGARYFGLSRANFLFHPNDAHALGLLTDYDEVTCDISKWGWQWNDDGRPACKATSDPATVRAEGLNVARLAAKFPNVTGAYCDDLLGLLKKFKYGPEEFANIRAAIREAKPDLKLWSVVYTHEFPQTDFWAGMRPHIDVVTLWVWKSDDLGQMIKYVDECRKLFPDKPIVMGVYLRDYTKRAPIPVDRVTAQMESIADLIAKGKLDGYSILGAVLIDGHRAQADAVRDFVAVQSGKA